MNALSSYLNLIEASAAHSAALLFIAGYPLLMSIIWTVTALIYFARREFRKRADAPALGYTPTVSVLIPCYCEELYIENTVASCLRLDYPDLDIVVVDDGSSDRTLEKVLPYVERGQVRLIAKADNEGKAMALNDALPCLRGEIVVVMDADCSPDPQLLRYMIPHFSSARVAAVTCNPRVVDRDTFLAKLQLIEFTSIVSIQKRAQRIWGRVMTMSGVLTALRRSAVIDVGLFSPDMATEDIDLTWKLHKKHYDVRYEPAARVWMRVPKDFASLWKQRKRWALGLAQVLRRHSRDMVSWRHRRQWPVLIESSLSILWAHLFVLFTGFWILSSAVSSSPLGASPIPEWWGMLIAIVCLVQLGTGVCLDRQYDNELGYYFPVAIYYPVIYWVLMAVITVSVTWKGLLRSRNSSLPVRWRIPRKA